MSEYLIKGETLTGIADAIRAKTGGTDAIAVSDMASSIEGIQSGGSDGGLHVEFHFDGSNEVTCNATFQQVLDAYRSCQIGIVTAYRHDNGFDNPATDTLIDVFTLYNKAIEELSQFKDFSYSSSPCFVLEGVTSWGCYLWLEESGAKFEWFD